MMKEVPKRDCHAYKMRDSRFFTSLGNQKKETKPNVKGLFPRSNKQTTKSWKIPNPNDTKGDPIRTKKKQK